MGLMSGTSLDAIDAVLVAFKEHQQPQLIQRSSIVLPNELKNLLTNIAHASSVTFRDLAVAEDGLTRLYAQTALAVIKHLKPEQLPLALGCHGQTLEHQPNSNPPYTLQLFNPSLLAELTGTNVICDFRRRDLAAGGQAAPLVPAFHHYVFKSKNQDRIIINLGGIANLTYLPADLNSKVIGFDTGPANLLLDAWYKAHKAGDYDPAGSNAASGKLILPLLNLALEDNFFKLVPPKSTGREYFNPTWLTKLLQKIPAYQHLAFEDVLCTLTELTALSLAQQIKRLDPNQAAEVYICGGGWHNTYLVSRIQNLIAPRALAATTQLGIPPQDVEAAAFAWLAWRHYTNQSGNLPSVTGASGPRILGGFYPA